MRLPDSVYTTAGVLVKAPGRQPDSALDYVQLVPSTVGFICDCGVHGVSRILLNSWMSFSLQSDMYSVSPSLPSFKQNSISISFILPTRSRIDHNQTAKFPMPAKLSASA